MSDRRENKKLREKISEILEVVSEIDSVKLKNTLREKLNELLEFENTSFYDSINYNRIFNSASNAMWIMDRNQKILDANKATKKIFGLGPEELKKSPCWKLVHNTKKVVKNCPFVRAKQSLKKEREIWKVNGKWLEVTIDPILDNDGKFAGAVHITRDITNEKETEIELINKEKKLEETVKLFRTMADTMPDMLWAKDLNKRFIFVNKAICENLLGAKDTDEPIGKTDLFFAERERARHPENPEWHTFGEICVDSDEVTLRAKKPMRFDEYGNVKGEFLFLDVHKAPMFNEEGEIIGIVGSARDVTQQKLFEKILHESEAKYKELFETAPVGYVILDRNGEILDANETVLKRFNYSKPELIGHNIREFVPKEDVPIVERNIKAILEKGFLETEARTLAKGNKRLLYLLLREKKIKLSDGSDGILSASIDVTDKITAEKALREREEQLSTLINSAPEDIVCFKDANHRWLLANKTLLRVFDLEKVNYRGKTDIQLAELTKPKYRKALETCIESDKKAWEEGKPTHFVEKIDKGKNKRLIFDIVKVPLFNKDGSRKGLILFGRNITQLVEAQKQIEESEEKFRSVWENSIDPMCLQDINQRLVYVNKAFCEMVGLKRDEIIGRKITEIISVKERASKNYRKAFREEKFPRYHQTEITLKNGTTKIVELSNSFIKLKDGRRLLLTIFRDVTEHRQLIEELTLAKEKAEEINRIKTQFFLYMSHELRTPFMGIIGYAQLIEEGNIDEKYKEMARKILKTSSRMIDTLSNILDLTKLEFDKEEAHIEKIDVIKLIEETRDNFINMARIKNLKFLLDLPDYPIIMETDFRMITSILNNLVNNAIKFTEKGHIKITARIRKEKLILKIKDTGIGIPEEKQKIIWDEFRQVSEGTTRTYQGSGIGLTIVKKYVKMFSGKVSLKSQVGKGSTFTVELPLKYVETN